MSSEWHVLKKLNGRKNRAGIKSSHLDGLRLAICLIHVNPLEAISKNGFWFNKPEAYKDQGGAGVQPAGILKYARDLKQGTNTEIGPKDFFEIASNQMSAWAPQYTSQ